MLVWPTLVQNVRDLFRHNLLHFLVIECALPTVHLLEYLCINRVFSTVRYVLIAYKRGHSPQMLGLYVLL